MSGIQDVTYETVYVVTRMVYIDGRSLQGLAGDLPGEFFTERFDPGAILPETVRQDTLDHLTRNELIMPVHVPVRTSEEQHP